MNKRFILGMVVATSLLGACSKSEKDQYGKFTVNSAVIEQDGALSNIEKAERLALAAEQLVTPASFMYVC